MKKKWFGAGFLIAAICTGLVLARLATQVPEQPVPSALEKQQALPAKGVKTGVSSKTDAGPVVPPSPGRPPAVRKADRLGGPDRLRQDLAKPEVRDMLLSEMKKSGEENPEAKLAELERALDEIDRRPSAEAGASPRKRYGVYSGPIGELVEALALDERQQQAVHQAMIGRDERNQEAQKRHLDDPAALRAGQEQAGRLYQEQMERILTPEQRRIWKGGR